MTAKKCTKKRDARAKIVVLLTKPIVFLKFSLPSPSSDLKVPNMAVRMSKVLIPWLWAVGFSARDMSPA